MHTQSSRSGNPKKLIRFICKMNFLGYYYPPQNPFEEYFSTVTQILTYVTSEGTQQHFRNNKSLNYFPDSFKLT